MSFLLDKLFNLHNKTGIVNVRMVITEEKILSNIEKVQKMINPKSKKQIVQLEDDTYFKDLVESIKTYLVEYPKKKNFPRSVYKAAYDLVEFATNQFEENTKRIEELIIQREKNINLAFELKSTLAKINKKEEGYEKELEAAADKYSDELVEALKLIANGNAEEKDAALKLVNARINNLESNFHIEIDMERIEDKSKALSYIGIEIAEALKYIPAPVEEIANVPFEQAAPVMQQMPQMQRMAAQPVNPVVQTPVNAPRVNQNVAAAQVQPQMQQQRPMPQMQQPQQKKVNPILQQQQNAQQQRSDAQVLNDAYMADTRFDVKPSLWQRFTNSKFIRTIKYIMKIRVVLELPALPEGRGENNF